MKVYDQTGSFIRPSKEIYLDWENDSIMKLNSYNYNIVPIEHDDDLVGF